MPPKQAKADLFAPTPQEWDAALKFTKMDTKSKTIARLVLLDRQPQATVAKENAVSRQWVGRIVARMIAALRASVGTPPTWITRPVTLPRKDWKKVAAIEKAAKARYTKELTKARARTR